MAKVPGIADLETSDKAANPALSVRLDNDAAADLGITVHQVGTTIRPLVAGDTIRCWMGPDGQMRMPPLRRVAGRRQDMQDSFKAALAALGLAARARPSPTRCWPPGRRGPSILVDCVIKQSYS
ncbi:MAG TPA: hypothetical protein VKT00_02225 [Casimicrobiaceae bacterium]|nr:hypothetical protein [Casimicrobiaceae bacterium]